MRIRQEEFSKTVAGWYFLPLNFSTKIKENGALYLGKDCYIYPIQIFSNQAFLNHHYY